MNTQALTGVVQETKYRTTDGAVFNEKVDAENHQFDLAYKEQILWIPNNLRCEAPLDNHDYNAKPLTTHELARMLLEHPEAGVRTHQGMAVDRVKLYARGGKVFAMIGEPSPPGI